MAQGVGPARAAVLAVGGVAAVVLAVGWAATVGPTAVLRGPGPEPDRTFVTPTPSPTESESAGPEQVLGQAPAEDAWWVAVVEGAVMIVVLLVVGWALLHLLRWLLELASRRRAAAALDADDPFDVLDEPSRLAAALGSGAADQARALASGTPREGIEACWAQLERQAGRAGVERRPWETSSDLTRRILVATGADRVSVDELGALYREARYSSHHLGEDDRRSAEAALARIQGSWSAPRLPGGTP